MYVDIYNSINTDPNHSQLIIFVYPQFAQVGLFISHFLHLPLSLLTHRELSNQFSRRSIDSTGLPNQLDQTKQKSYKIFWLLGECRVFGDRSYEMEV